MQSPQRMETPPENPAALGLDREAAREPSEAPLSVGQRAARLIERWPARSLAGLTTNMLLTLPAPRPIQLPYAPAGRPSGTMDLVPVVTSVKVVLIVVIFAVVLIFAARGGSVIRRKEHENDGRGPDDST
jgi:hypothetical protein